jgi:hypothetical protein
VVIQLLSGGVGGGGTIVAQAGRTGSGMGVTTFGASVDGRGDGPINSNHFGDGWHYGSGEGNGYGYGYLTGNLVGDGEGGGVGYFVRFLLCVDNTDLRASIINQLVRVTP